MALNLAFYSVAQTIAQPDAPMNSRGRPMGRFSMAAIGLRAFSEMLDPVGLIRSEIFATVQSHYLFYRRSLWRLPHLSKISPSRRCITKIFVLTS